MTPAPTVHHECHPGRQPVVTLHCLPTAGLSMTSQLRAAATAVAVGTVAQWLKVKSDHFQNGQLMTAAGQAVGVRDVEGVTVPSQALPQWPSSLVEEEQTG